MSHGRGFWMGSARAGAMTVPDDRAVGGLITAGMSVDVLVSAQVNVPPDLMAEGKYYTILTDRKHVHVFPVYGGIKFY